MIGRSTPNVCEKAGVQYTSSSLPLDNPIVSISDLTDDDREDLKAQIRLLTRDLQVKFRHVFDVAFTSIRARIDHERLVLTLMSDEVGMLEENDKQLTEAKDVYDVLKVIRPHCSCFNYELLEVIVKVHGTGEDKAALCCYIEDFSTYCRQIPCTEGVFDVDSNSNSASKRVKIKFKLDYDAGKIRLDKIKGIQQRIAQVLGIKTSSLYLCQLEEGCIMMEFLLTTCTARKVLPISDDIKNALVTAVNLISIQCHNTEYDMSDSSTSESVPRLSSNNVPKEGHNYYHSPQSKSVTVRQQQCTKKLGHSNSLRRKFFAKSNLLQLDSYNASVDQASSTWKTPDDHTPALITVENADNNHNKQSLKPDRKHASNTLSSPLHVKPRFPHSTSGSSIDSVSRTSSLSSLPCGSKRPSRESSNACAVDIASPLLESQRSLSINGPGADGKFIQLAMTKKLGHSNSLRRKCFAKSNLLQLDSCSASADQASSTPDDHIPALITVEDAYNGHNKQSPKPKRKHASNTLSSPLHVKPQFPTLTHTTSGTSIDSGVGLSRASSLWKTPDDLTPFLITVEDADDKQSLKFSKWKHDSVTQNTLFSSLEKPPSPTLSKLSTDSGLGLSRAGSLSSLSWTCGSKQPSRESSSTADNIDDLTQCIHRLSISRGAVEDLKSAVQTLLDDLEQQPQTEQIHKQGDLNADFKSSDQVESDGPYFPKRRHSSAGLYIPLTQRQSRLVERKRSAQPFLHRSMKDSISNSTPRRRKPSACFVCKRKHRELTMSAESIFVKTARFPDHRKQRRYTEVFKVCTES